MTLLPRATFATLRITLASILLSWIPAASAGAPDVTIDISVLDQAKHPVAGVAVRIEGAPGVVFSSVTDEHGKAAFPPLERGHYQLSAAKEGFQPIQASELDLSTPGTHPVELTLSPAATRRESIDVHETVSAVDQASSSSTSVPATVAKELPGRPATVTDMLPLIPGAARSPGGGLQVSGTGEQRSALIVNSADVTDPATGQFGLTVPIDQVQSLNLYQTPFLVEFGRFTAGLVSVETRRGGDSWKWELNDPFPEFRIRSWDVRGLRTATPRLNFEGPLVPGKLYLSEGVEYELKKIEVFTLPFPYNQKKQEGVNSFAQIDWIKSGNHLLTATVHVAPQRRDFVNLDYFNPQTTTPDASTHNYTTTLADHLSLHGALFDNTVSLTLFDARVWGQGPQDLTITPAGNTGNYFAQQQRNASRIGWSSTYSFAPVKALGTHNLKAGSYIAESSDHGQVNEHPIDILGANSLLLERISFTGGQPFRMSDTELAFFGQDHWSISPRMAIDFGLRAESQQVSEAMRLAPRAGLAWNPFANAGTIVRAGVGLFYDRVPLNVYSFGDYPNQVVTFYDNGQAAAGPFLYQNGLGEVTIRPPFVFQEPHAGNFSPRSTNWTVQVEQPVSPSLKLRAGYTQNQSSGLVVLNSITPDPATAVGAHVLSGTGQSRYRKFDVTAKLRMPLSGQLFFSYVRSHAQGDLNDFSSYLGSFPLAILRPNQFASLPTDLPNRFLAWGLVPLPWKFRISPTVEYRNGFPYLVTDAAQNYAGLPNQSRFPNFFSVDARVSKDLKVNPKYSVRLSVSTYNLTNHFNPEAFHNNLADSAYGLFFGDRHRRFTADFDVIF